jgi:hypothetical protein
MNLLSQTPIQLDMQSKLAKELKAEREVREAQERVLQTHINFPIFLPIFPDFLERLSHLAPIY